MGEETCKSCRSWVDDIYWTHFQFVHFAQFLRSGYEQHLAIPKRFSDNLKKKLPENVALRGPGGMLWNVGLTSRDDTLYFTHGWQQFLKDHLLKENDFLVFKYNGESQFDVLIFDGESFCEKAASYFVRKCGHAEHGNGNLNKRKDTDKFLEEADTPSNAAVQCASPEKSVHGNSTRVPAAAPSETPSKKTSNTGVECASPEQLIDVNGVTVPAAVPPQSGGERTSNLVSAVKQVQTKRRGRPPKASSGQRGRPPKVSNPRGGVNWVTDSEAAYMTRSGTYQALYNGRSVAESGKGNALHLDQAACTNVQT